MKPIDHTPENIIKFYNQLKQDVKDKYIKLVDTNGIFRPLTPERLYKAKDFTLYNTTIDGIVAHIDDDNGYLVEVPIKRFTIYSEELTVQIPVKKSWFEKVRSWFE